MSDEKREAHNLYVQYVSLSTDFVGLPDTEVADQLAQARARVSMLVFQFLCQCRPQERFRHNEFPNIISLSSRMDGFDMEKAVEAFSNLEQYLLLLCLMPWKQEYHKLKKYGGFYQSKIESHLRGAESIFRLIGFTERVKGFLTWTHNVKADIIQYVAFECFCAVIECQIISDIWRRTRHGQLQIFEIVNIRLQTAGSADIVVSFIESKYHVPKPQVAMNTVDCKVLEERKNAIGHNPTDTFRNRLEEHIKTAQKLSSGKEVDSDIPFMDDDTKEQELTPGNFDDHLIASLQIVGEKEASPDISADQVSGLRPSQEWSFVREKLEKNYGKKYFDGPPKDLLSGEKEIDLMNKQKNYQKIMGDVPLSGTYRLPGQQEVMLTHHGSKTVPTSVSKGIVYVSGSSTFPTDGQFVPTIPNRHDFDVLKRGTSYSQPIARTFKTEPLLRSHAEREISPLSQSVTLMSGNTDNIMKLQKRSSLPVNPKDKNMHGLYPGTQHASISSKMDKNTPTSGYSTGSQSFSVATSRNVSDGVNGVDIGAINRALGQNYSLSWNCSYCTFANASDSQICRMCSKTREVPEMDSPPAGTQHRVCEKCTLENPKELLECTACGSQLRNTQTVV